MRVSNTAMPVPGVFWGIVLIAMAVAAQGNASPTIRWSGIQDRRLAPVEPEFDINGDGVVDFLFENIQGTLSLIPSLGSAATADPTWQAGHLSYRPLGPGTHVGETLDPPYVWDEDERYLVSYVILDESGQIAGGGPWHGVLEGLLGVSFGIEGQTHYGWLRMSDVTSTTFILHDWAYETRPDGGIAAGAVPEPGTMVLGVAGALMLWGRKRRRKA